MRPLALSVLALSLALTPALPACAEADGRLMAAGEMVEMRLVQWSGGMARFDGDVEFRRDPATGQLVGAFPAGRTEYPVQGRTITVTWPRMADSVFLSPHDGEARHLGVALPEMELTVSLDGKELARGQISAEYEARLEGDGHLPTAARSRFSDLRHDGKTILRELTMETGPLHEGKGDLFAMELYDLALPLPMGQLDIASLELRQENSFAHDRLAIAEMEDMYTERLLLVRDHDGEDWATTRERELASRLADALTALPVQIQGDSHVRLTVGDLEFTRESSGVAGAMPETGPISLTLPRLTVQGETVIPGDASQPVTQRLTLDWQGLEASHPRLNAMPVPASGHVTQRLANLSPALMEPMLAQWTRAGWLADPRQPAAGFAPLVLTAMATLPPQLVEAGARLDHDIWLQSGPLLAQGGFTVHPVAGPEAIKGGLPVRVEADITLSGLADALAHWPEASREGIALRRLLASPHVTRLSDDRAILRGGQKASP